MCVVRREPVLSEVGHKLVYGQPSLPDSPARVLDGVDHVAHLASVTPAAPRGTGAVAAGRTAYRTKTNASFTRK